MRPDPRHVVTRWYRAPELLLLEQVRPSRARRDLKPTGLARIRKLAQQFGWKFRLESSSWPKVWVGPANLTCTAQVYTAAIDVWSAGESDDDVFSTTTHEQPTKDNSLCLIARLHPRGAALVDRAGEPDRAPRAGPQLPRSGRRLSTLSVTHSKSLLYGAFVWAGWARRAVNQPKTAVGGPGSPRALPGGLGVPALRGHPGPGPGRLARPGGPRAHPTHPTH
jgi:hypothetical protein